MHWGYIPGILKVWSGQSLFENIHICCSLLWQSRKGSQSVGALTSFLFCFSVLFKNLRYSWFTTLYKFQAYSIIQHSESQFFLKFLLNVLQHCFCFTFWRFSHKAYRILAPNQGSHPHPFSVEGEVLTTRPTGKSWFTFFFLMFFLFFFNLTVFLKLCSICSYYKILPLVCVLWELGRAGETCQLVRPPGSRSLPFLPALLSVLAVPLSFLEDIQNPESRLARKKLLGSLTPPQFILLGIYPKLSQHTLEREVSTMCSMKKDLLGT